VTDMHQLGGGQTEGSLFMPVLPCLLPYFTVLAWHGLLYALACPTLYCTVLACNS
jgi:hypothetical protein